MLEVVWSCASASPACLHDVGIATCWMVWRLNPGVGTRFSVPVETGAGPTSPPVQWVQGFFPGGKLARAGLSWPALGCNFGSMASIASVSQAE